MAEFSANAVQTVLPSGAVLFTETPVPCNRGFVYHREGSGTLRLASPARMSAYQNFAWNNCPCCRIPEALYLVSFHANIAIPTGGTVEPITLAITVNGDADLSSSMIFTPAAVDTYGNVGAEIMVAVPAICGCDSVSVRNISEQSILVQNANLVVALETVRY